jgi:hypothetical protein
VTNAPAFSYDGRFPVTGADTLLTLTDDVSFLAGKHTLKAGIYGEAAHHVEGNQGTFSGSFSFAKDTNNPYDSNYAYSNALLGNFQTYTESSSRPRADARSTIIEGYVQDTWKISRKLTLDYGVRFAWATPYRQVDQTSSGFAPQLFNSSQAPQLFVPVISGGKRLAKNPVTGEILPSGYIDNYVPGTGNTSNGIALGTDPNYPTGFINQWKVQPEPRVGFAFDPKGDGKTSIRGGFGVFHNLRYPGDINRTGLNQNPPNQLTTKIIDGNLATFRSTTALLAPPSVTGLRVDTKVPTLYNFSLGVQRNVGFGTVVDVAYVGSLGRQLMQNRNINLVAPGARFQNPDPSSTSAKFVALPDDFFRPYPGYGNVTFYTNDGNSNYNSLQVSVNRRFAKSLQFGIAYTFSKAFGYGDRDLATVSTYYSRGRDYGLMPYDQTHVLVFNYTWDLPKASRLWNNVVVRALFDNWQLSGITTFASGVPLGLSYSTTDGADILGGGDPARALRTGALQLPAGERTFARWFDTSAVARPAVGDSGNSRKDDIRGPGINDWDVTVFKNVPVGKTTLQLRWEAYNLFNHTQGLGVDTGARFDTTGAQVNGSFGTVNSTRSPRIMQASLRFMF